MQTTSRNVSIRISRSCSKANADSSRTNALSIFANGKTHRTRRGKLLRTNGTGPTPANKRRFPHPGRAKTNSGLLLPGSTMFTAIGTYSAPVLRSKNSAQNRLTDSSIPLGMTAYPAGSAESACGNKRLREIGRARKNELLSFRRKFRRRDDARWNEAQRGAADFFLRGGAGFVVLGVLVDLPEIVKLGVSQNIFGTQHRRHHGMILVVVLVHAVAPNEVQVRITILEFFADRGDMARVIVIVNWIGLLLADDAAVENVTLLGQSDFDQLAFAKLD